MRFSAIRAVTFQNFLAASIVLATFRLLHVSMDIAQSELTPTVLAWLPHVAVAQQSRNISTCLPRNSLAWLKGPRHGNAVDPLIGYHSVQKMLLNLPRMLHSPSVMNSLLRESLAHNSSQFLSFENDIEINSGSIRRWAVRLIYLAIYRHQHEPARAEAQSNNLQCEQEQPSFKLGEYDYECPGTEFLLTRMWNNGLGASMEIFGIASLMAGLATNRTVLFLNNAPTTFNQLTPPWPLASCPRRDFQCFFAPTSPCVLTEKQLRSSNIYQLKKKEKEVLFDKGILPEGHENDEIVYFHPIQRVGSFRFGGKVEPALRKIALSLINELPREDPRRPVLLRAADSIPETDAPRREYDFHWSTSKIAHGLLFYLLRPHPTNRQKLNEMLKESVPLHFDPSQAIGMPIRASDKCNKESECLTFAQNVRAVHNFRKELPRQSQNASLIIFTTESKAMTQEYLNYTADKRFPFVTNRHDVPPDTGRLAKVSNTSLLNMTADEAMLLAVSSLQLQLMPQSSVLNCCSNFHALIHAYLFEGCGAAREPANIRCLQEEEDPEVRVCCGRPGHRNLCWRQRQEEIQDREAATKHSRTTLKRFNRPRRFRRFRHRKRASRAP